jgi:hypothetical protein
VDVAAGSATGGVGAEVAGGDGGARPREARIVLALWLRERLVKVTWYQLLSAKEWVLRGQCGEPRSSGDQQFPAVV